MNRTRIETFDFTWNPVVGCSRGCSFCYARRFAERGMGEYGKYAKGNRFIPRCFPERLSEPSHLLRPSWIFTVSMGDLFDPAISLSFINRVWLMMRCVDRHTYFVLTKQPGRMVEFFRDYSQYGMIKGLPNVWTGVSITNQRDANERIPLLLQTPTAHRFISAEPLLGPIRLIADWLPSGTENGAALRKLGYGHPAISWLIIGAQTGPGAVPPAVEWVGDLTRQCLDAGVPVFHKDSLRNLPWPPGTIYDNPFGNSGLWKREKP